VNCLILCCDFPPYNTIGARRPFSWYQHFSENGIHPVVITYDWELFINQTHSTLPESTSSSSFNEQADAELIKVKHRHILPDRIYWRFGPSHRIFRRRLYNFLYKILSFPFFAFDRHRPIFKQAQQLLNERNDIDCLLTSGEPFILHKYGYLLSKKFNIPWIADFRDGWMNNYAMHYRRSPGFRVIVQWEKLFEKKYLKQATALTTVDPILCESLKEIHHKDTHVIYNGFEKIVDATIPLSHSKLILIHSGSIAEKQQIFFLLDAVLELHNDNLIHAEEIEIHFAGPSYSVYFKNIYEKIMSSALAAYCHFHPKTTPDDSLLFASQADFLLTFTDEEFSLIAAKNYEYIAARRPILVLPSDNSLTDKFVKELSAGNIFSSTEQLKTFLLEQINSKQKSGNNIASSLSHEKAEFYSRKNQSAIMSSIIKKYV
jgi:glycosyltransferase involved in cell wall biosynthesis